MSPERAADPTLLRRATQLLDAQGPLADGALTEALHHGNASLHDVRVALSRLEDAGLLCFDARGWHLPDAASPSLASFAFTWPLGGR